MYLSLSLYIYIYIYIYKGLRGGARRDPTVGGALNALKFQCVQCESLSELFL